MQSIYHKLFLCQQYFLILFKVKKSKKNSLLIRSFKHWFCAKYNLEELICIFQKITAGAGAVYCISRVAYALGYYTGGECWRPETTCRKKNDKPICIILNDEKILN